MVKKPKVGERYYHYCERPIETMKGWGVVSEVGPIRSKFVFENNTDGESSESQ